MMKTLLIAMSCVMLLAVGANADLISNAGFDEGGNWGYGSFPISPPSWLNSNNGPHAGDGVSYGENVFGNGNKAAFMKNTGLDNYLQQGLAGVDAGTVGSYTIGMDLGLRQHSYYERDTHDDPTQAGDIFTLRVSLWDTTADVELAGQTFERVYPDQPYVNDIDNMTPESFNLTYDNSGLSGHGVAIRFTHMTSLEGKYGLKQMCIDDVTVVPEPATMALLALGGLGLLKRRRSC